MQRREFLAKTALGASAALALGGCTREQIEGKKSLSVNRNRKTTLKLATSWPAHFPIMGTGVDRFAEQVGRMSGGSLVIKVYPKNILVPALAVFDATSSGQIDCFHSGVYYWKGKNSALGIFGGVPLTFLPGEIQAWMHHGGGMELWREIYARYNLHPLIGGNTGPQMGGWYRKPIRDVADLKGLKMRIPGLAGEVMARLGVNPILLPAGEIYTALERGTIDATEWVGPALDIRMGFYKVAPHYYSGWHEPGSILELTFNKVVWERLADEHKAIIETASEMMNAQMLLEFAAENAKALATLTEKGVEIRPYPEPIIQAAKQALDEVIEDSSAANADFKRVWQSASAFYATIKAWSDVETRWFMNIR